MYILSYAINRMKRNIMGCTALTLISLVIVLFLCLLNSTLVQKEQQLNEVYNNLDVECVVSNLRGTQTDDLYIKNYIIDLFLTDESTYLGKKDAIPFSSYFKDLKLKFTLKYELLSEDQKVFITDVYNANNLIGLTDPSVDSILAPVNNVGITYFDDYNEALFLSDKPVCIVSSGLYQTLPIDNEGNSYLRMAVGDSVQSKQKYEEQRLQVVGTYEGDGKDIYCSWEIINSLSIKVAGMIHADSLSCMIKDNHQIDSIKELLARYFTNVDFTGTVKPYTASNVLRSFDYAITVYDGTFINTVSKIKDNIKVLEILQPIIIMISLGIGFLASLLFVRNRKQEFAVMRSLGTKKTMVFGEAFIEQFCLGLIGTVLGLITYYALHKFEILPPLGSIGAFLLCYLAGSSIVVYWIVNVKVMAILKEKE